MKIFTTVICCFSVFLFFTGCASSETIVIKPVEESLNKYQNFLLSVNNKTEDNINNEVADLQKVVIEKIKDRGLFKMSEPLTDNSSTKDNLIVKASITDINTVSGFTRFMIGIFAGSAYITADVELLDGNSKQTIGNYTVTGKSGGTGASGGTGDAIEMTSNEIVKIITDNYSSVAKTNTTAAKDIPQAAPVKEEKVVKNEAGYIKSNLKTSKSTLFGGLSIATGDFGSTKSANGSYANTGFAIMYEYNNRIARNINWSSSAVFSLNGMDEASLEKTMQYSLNSSAKLSSSGSIFNIWLMSGISGEFEASPDINIYGTAQLGIIFSNYPDITMDYSSYYTNYSITQESKMATAFAYCIGAGVKMGSFDFTLRLLGASPEFKQTASARGNTVTVKSSLPVSIVLLGAGYRF